MRRQNAAWPVTSTSLPELHVPKGVPDKPLWHRSRPGGTHGRPRYLDRRERERFARKERARPPIFVPSGLHALSALGRLSVGPDLDVHVKGLEEYAEAGVDELFVQQIGGRHDDFFAAYEREVIPRFD